MGISRAENRWRTALAAIVVGALATGTLTVGASGAVAVETPTTVVETPERSGREAPVPEQHEEPTDSAGSGDEARVESPAEEQGERETAPPAAPVDVAQPAADAANRALELPDVEALAVTATQFPDKALRDCVNGIISAKKKPIDQLDAISCPNKGIVEITGMQLAKKAKSIAFQGNKIYRIDELFDLPELIGLDLTNNQIYNLPWAPVTSKLETLWLRGNFMTELYELQGLPRLKALSVGENPNLKILQHLNYQKLVPGATTPALKEIYASNSPKLENAFLPDLKLRKFEASETAISDFSKVGWSMTEGARTFKAYDVKVTRPDVFVGERFESSVAPASGFQKSVGTSLTGIPWRSSGLSDGSGYYHVEQPVGSFTAKFTFRPHFVQDPNAPLTADSGGSAWESGKVVATGVTDLDPNLKLCLQNFYGLPSTSMITREAFAALTTLNCADKNIAHLKGLEHATSLTQLNMQGNPITSLAPLASLKTLESVNVSGTRVKDFTSIGWRTSTSIKRVTLKADALQVDLGAGLIGRWLGKLVTAPVGWGEGTVTANSTTTHVAPAAGEPKQLLPQVANANWQATFKIAPPANVAQAPYFSTDSVVAGTYSSVVRGSAAVVPDMALRACLWSALGVPTDQPIAKESIAELTSLECRDAGISDITGLEHASNLATLDLGSNNIRSAQPLSKLPKLTELNLAHNKLTDLTPLAGLTTLMHLYVQGNQNTSVDQLETLVNLQTLWAGANDKVTSVDRLNKLTKLVRLNLTNMSSLETISLPALSLSELSLQGTRVSDFSNIGWRASTAASPVTLVASNLQVSLGDQSVGARFGHTIVAPRGWTEGTVTPPAGTVYSAATAGAPKTFLASAKNPSWESTFAFNRPAAGGSAPFFSTDSVIDGIFSATIAGTDAVVSDTALQACVRDAIGLPGGSVITIEALKQLTTLDCSSKGVKDLTGLELATNAKSLKLANNQITSIAPLAGLSQLTSLAISGQSVSLAPATVQTKYPNVVRDAQGAAIAPVNTTYYFGAPDNAFQYPASLAGQTRTESWSKLVTIGTAQATFTGTLTRTVAAAITMPDAKLRACVNEQLAQLTQSGRASDRRISAAEMELITDLTCADEGVSDLTGLEHASALAQLNIDSNQVTSLEPLASLTELTSLSASGNQIDSLTPLAGLSKLATLDVSKNHISELGELSNNLALTSLKFTGNQVADISVISTLTKLTLVDADGQKIAGADAYVGIPVANPIKGVVGAPVTPTAASMAYRAATNDFVYSTGTASQQDLWTVSTGLAGKAFSGTITRKVLAGTAPEKPVTDPVLAACIVGADGVAPTKEMLEGLTTLVCDNKGIVSLSGIEGAVNLKSLSVNGNKLTDLSPLKNLATLATVSATGQVITAANAYVGVPVKNPVKNISGAAVSSSSAAYDASANAFLYQAANNSQADPWSIAIPGGTFSGVLNRVVAGGSVPEVPITDPELQACVIATVTGGTSTQAPTKQQLEALEVLHCDRMGIRSLTGLEAAVNLKDVSLDGNEIVDLRPLAELKKLAALSVKEQDAKGAPAFVQVPFKNPIIGLAGAVTPKDTTEYRQSDNSFLFAAANAAKVTTWNKPLNGASGVIGAFEGKITRVVNAGTVPTDPVTDPELQGCVISELGGAGQGAVTVEQLEALTELNCDNRGLTSLAGLSAAKNLERLSVNGNKLADLSTLAGLAKLATLSATGQTVAQPEAFVGVAVANPVKLVSGAPVEFSANYDAVAHEFVFTAAQASQVDAWSTAVAGGTFSGELTRKVSAGTTPTDPVTDPELQSCILGGAAGDPTSEQIAALTELNCDNLGIESIAGLSGAKNLTKLSVNGNKIVDLSPLANLSKLTEISAAGQVSVRSTVVVGVPVKNPVKSVDGTAVSFAANYLPASNQLVYSAVTPNQVDAWSAPVSGGVFAGELKRVVEGGTLPLDPITDPKLQGCVFNELTGAGMSEVPTVEMLEALTEIHCDYEGVENLAGIERAVNVTDVSFNGNHITDVTPLKGLAKAAKLSVRDQRVEAADAVVGVPVANPVRGFNGPIAPVEVLDYLPLKHEFLYRAASTQKVNNWNQALQTASGDSLGVFSGMLTRAQVVAGTVPTDPVTDPELQGCVISELGGAGQGAVTVEQLEALTELNCDNRGLTSLAGLSAAKNLEKLSVNGNKLTDLSPLAGLAKLATLSATGQTVAQPDIYTGVAATNPVVSVDGASVAFKSPEYRADTNSFVFTRENLKREDAWSAQISLGALTGAFEGKLVRKVTEAKPVTFPDAKLKACVASHLKVASTSTITRPQLAELTVLDCSSQGITNLQGLTYASGLETLKLQGNKITSIAPLFGLDSLTNLDLTGQQVDAGSVETRDPLANPVIGLDGKPVVTGWSQFYVKKSNAFVYGVPNPKQQESWKVDVVIGSAATWFSGVLSVNVKPKVEKPKPVPWKFDDVLNPNQPFYTQIYWMAEMKLSTGTVTRDASGKIIKRMYYPSHSMSREAMAAFLYRYAGSPKFTAPKNSPFIDVPTNHKFYKEITWLADQKVTTGVKTPAGLAYQPAGQVSREAMAAFLFRMSGEQFTPPTKSAFRDVKPGQKFYKEIAWMAARGISEGVTVDKKKNIKEYRPKSSITREAMAAFLYRHHHLD